MYNEKYKNIPQILLYFYFLQPKFKISKNIDI